MKTLSKRISKKLTTKKGVIKACYASVLPMLNNPKQKVYLYAWRRSKGCHNLYSLAGNIQQGLKILGIDFEEKNDAPKGGKEGDFIQLTVKGRRQVAFYNAQEKKEAVKQEVNYEITSLTDESVYHIGVSANNGKPASFLNVVLNDKSVNKGCKIRPVDSELWISKKISIIQLAQLYFGIKNGLLVRLLS